MDQPQLRQQIEATRSRILQFAQRYRGKPASPAELEQLFQELSAVFEDLETADREIEARVHEQIAGLEQTLEQVKIGEADRKSLMEENRRQRVLLDSIFEADPGGVAVLVGEDLRFAFLNPAYRYIIPNPVRDPLGLPYHQAWPRKNKFGYRDQLRNVLKTGKPFQRCGIEHRFPDGSSRIFTLQARRIEWENEPAVLLILWDTTDLKRAERALQESIRQEKQKTAQLEAVLETVPALVWIAHDRESRVVTGSRYSSEFLHMHPGDNLSKTAPEGLIPRHYHPLKDGQEIPSEQLPVQMAAAQGAFVQDYEFDVKFDDGEIRSLIGNASPLFDETGQPNGAVSAFIDITEHKMVEEALQETNRKYQELVRFAPAGIYEVDFRTRRYTTVNDVMCQLTGYSRDELLAMDAFELLDEAGRKLFQKRIQQWLAGEKPVENVEYRIKTRDGRLIDTLLSVTFKKDEAGNPCGATVVGIDITARKQAEQALLESQRRTQEILEGITNSYFELDREWRFTAMNTEAGRKMGLQPVKAIGKNIWELFPELVGSEQEKALRSVMEKRQPLHVELRGVINGGWYEHHIYPSPAGIVSYTSDVTGNKQAEAALREKEEHLRLASQGARFGTFTYSFETGEAHWSPELRALWGLKDDEPALFDRDLAYVGIHPEDKPRFAAAMAAARDPAGDGRLDLEYRVVHPDGTIHWLDVHGQTEFTGEGTLRHAWRTAGAALDITARKQAEEKLAYQSMLLEHVHDVVVAMDAEMNITSWNRSAEELSGVRAQDAIGKKFYDLVPRKNASLAEREADREKILKDGLSQSENIYLHPDGREVVLESVNIALQDADGRIIGYLTTSRDVTDRRTHEQEVSDRTIRIELQRRLLEQREQERLKIARDLHDGPVQELTGLTYALEGLAYNAGDLRLAEELQALRSGVQTQIDDLRRFAQELRPPNLVKFGLEKTILSHLDDFREKYPAIQVDFRCELGPARLADEVRLGLFRIFQEMMTNIAKHSQASQVRISARRTSREVSLEIQDNGVGFAVPREWLELARAGHLGLVGMQERAEEIGGKWEIESHPGQGTRIRVSVPVSR